MKRNRIYFVDEDAAARRANVRGLISLLDNPEIQVIAQEPLHAMADYNELLAKPDTAAFILDQRMKGGGIGYNGTDLASHLRGIDGKMPIYILTGHSRERQDFAGCEHLVENIIGKEDIEDANSEEAKTVKARMLRHLDVFNDVRNDRESRFHDLLVKSLREALTPEEQTEMDRLEGEATAAVLAEERAKEQNLARAVETVKGLIRAGNLPL
ncbi:MAG TPA: hypothetical protein VGG34_01275 [Opitutaceae bacterium]|jgi:DNA-binding NarL/FixJ family response regulator